MVEHLPAHYLVAVHIPNIAHLIENIFIYKSLYIKLRVCESVKTHHLVSGTISEIESNTLQPHISESRIMLMLAMQTVGLTLAMSRINFANLWD